MAVPEGAQQGCAPVNLDQTSVVVFLIQFCIRMLQNNPQMA